MGNIEIQIAYNEVVNLEIRENDDPYLLALNFCAKYHLNEIAVDVIEKRIGKVMAEEKFKKMLEKTTAEKKKREKKKMKEIEVKKKVLPPKNTAEIGMKLY
jgi:hypothetical protein